MTAPFQTIYVARGNSDRTEGRGQMVDRAMFSTARAAHAFIITGACGVQGCKGDGEIVERSFVMDGETIVARDILLWGYRKDFREQWGYGWIDNRDAPVQDPDYKEYMRLKEKFEGSAAEAAAKGSAK